MGPCWHQFWDHAKTNPGPFWDNFGTILRPFRNHIVTFHWTILSNFNSILGSCRDHPGIISKSCGIILESVSYYFQPWGSRDYVKMIRKISMGMFQIKAFHSPKMPLASPKGWADAGVGIGIGCGGWESEHTNNLQMVEVL